MNIYRFAIYISFAICICYSAPTSTYDRDNVKLDSDNVVYYDYKEQDNININPVFFDTKPEINARYFSILGLGTIDTIDMNGGAIDISYPFYIKSNTAKIYMNNSFASVTSIKKALNNASMYYSIMMGADFSVPVNFKTIISHAIFGIDMGYSSSFNDAFAFDGYFGFDFVYKAFVFRPFISLNAYMISALSDTSSSQLPSGFYGVLGFNVYHYYDKFTTFFHIAMNYDFIKDNIGIFITLPNEMVTLLYGNTLRIESRLEINYLLYDRINIKGYLGGSFSTAYRDVNAYLGIGIGYKFKSNWIGTNENR